MANGKKDQAKEMVENYNLDKTPQLLITKRLYTKRCTAFLNIFN